MCLGALFFVGGGRDGRLTGQLHVRAGGGRFACRPGCSWRLSGGLGGGEPSALRGMAARAEFVGV